MFAPLWFEGLLASCRLFVWVLQCMNPLFVNQQVHIIECSVTPTCLEMLLTPSSLVLSSSLPDSLQGPGSIDQAHKIDEWIAVSELLKMRSILARWWGIDEG